MKKIILLIVLTFFVIPAFAADYWKMTGVMAAYPGGPLGSPFSAPIDNPAKYADEKTCNAAIRKLTQTVPVFAAVNNGNVLPTEDAKGGYVAVAAKCFKYQE